MMKRKSVLWAALLMAAVSLLSCTEEGVTILGMVEDMEKEKDTPICFLTRNPLTTDTCYVTLTAEGTFEQRLPIKERRELYLMVNKKIVARFLVERGDIVDLSWKGYSPSTTIRFADPARERERMLSELLTERFNPKWNALSEKISRATPPYDAILLDDIEKYADEYRQTIEEFEQEHGVLPHKEAFLVDGYFNALGPVQYSLEAIEQLKQRGLRSGLPEDTVTGKAAYEVLPARYLAHRAYRSFLWNWTNLYVRKLTGPADSVTSLYERFIERMDTTFRIMQDRETAEWALAYRAPFTEFDLAQNEALSYLNHLKNELTFSWAKEYVQQTIDKLTPYQAGKQAPDFLLVDESGKEYTLADFRGKYLYIGFWSRGCRVCHREFKHIPALREKYRAFDDRLAYAFVYLGEEEDEVWLKSIEKHGSRQGINLRAAKRDDNVYNITGFPTYILIGPDGKMVEHHTARPSELLQTGENVLDKALQGKQKQD